MKKLTLGALSACLFFTLSANVLAGSTNFNANPPYTATDVPIAETYSSFDVNGTDVYGWANGNIYVGNLNGTNNVLSGQLDRPTAYLDGATTIFNSFTYYDASQNSLWLGFTNLGNTDDRIYSVDLNTNTWSTDFAGLIGNYDLRIEDGEVYVSGNPLAASFGADARIYNLGAVASALTNSATEIINLGGFSPGFDFDSAGNLIVATADYDGTDELLRFAEGDLGGPVLNRGDGEVLSTMAGGSSGAVVDDADNIYFSTNTAIRQVGKWNGTAGSAENFDVVGTTINFVGGLDAEGDVESKDNGDLFIGLSGQPGFVQVPEPATGSLFLLAGLGALAFRRRRA